MMVPMVETSSNSSALESSTCNNLHSCRTIWNIIWSCFFTLFACAWLSVHPNVPAPDDTWGRRATRRIWTMIAVLLAPELLVGWAMRQRTIASKIAKDNKKYGWTKTHGFFVVMGGFMKCDKDGLPDHTVAIDEVDTIPNKTKRGILEEDITARSKGDALSKTFAILQTTWFILQCISRAVEGLPVTELEVATTAFCVLNFVTYILWWNKPLNVDSPVRICTDGEATEEVEEEAEAEEETEEEEEEVGWIDACRSMWKTFKQGLADIPDEIYRPIAAMTARHGAFETTLFFPIHLVFIILRGNSSNSNPRRVGTFGPSHGNTKLDAIMSAVVGSVFGAIHCTAWNSQPTQAEQLAWGAAAFYVTALPLLFAVAVWFDNRNIYSAPSQIPNFDTWALNCVFNVGFIYFLARLTLLVLPLISLRSLPPRAFNSVNWIQFIPHI